MIKNARFEKCKISASLLGGLVAVCLLSFGMFAISDIMGHRAFNLGNRLSVYGSLLINNSNKKINVFFHTDSNKNTLLILLLLNR